MTQIVKNLPAMQETAVWSLGWEDPLEKGMATHDSILVWRIPWTVEPDRLQSMASQRVGHDLLLWVRFKATMQGRGTKTEPSGVLELGEGPLNYKIEHWWIYTHMCMYEWSDARQHLKGLENKECWLFLPDKLENLKTEETLEWVHREVLPQ